MGNNAVLLLWSVQDFLTSTVTQWIVTCVLAAFAFSGRLSVRLTNIFLGLAALIMFWRFSRVEELSRFDWLQWIFSMALVGSALGACVFLAARTLEPPVPEVVLFRHSSLFTRKRKRRLNRKLAEFKAYLSSLGFEFSSKKIPLGIGQKGHGFAKEDMVGGHHITLRAEELDDLTKATEAFSDYSFGRMFFNPILPFKRNEQLGRQFMAEAFATYFNWSFWNRPEATPRDWPSVFWTIRERYGKAFTDDLLAHAALSFLERPTTFRDTDVSEPPGSQMINRKHDVFTRVIQSHLFTGNREVDNNDERWPIIFQIIKEHGYPVRE